MHTGNSTFKCRLLMVVLALIIAGGMDVPASANPQKTVRVGWFESPYFHKDEAGNRSGYAYEYQLKVAAISGWTYEYVEGTWSELLEKLKRGEIDLLSDVTPSAELKEEMFFSIHEMAHDEYALFTLKDNNQILFSDLESLIGKRIAVQSGRIQLGMMRRWMMMHDPQCMIEEVDADVQTLKSRLEQGDFDGIVIPVNEGGNEYKLAFKIGTLNANFAVNMSKPELREELIDAMDQIRNTSPAYIYQLTNKYLNNSLFNHFLPEMECGWLEQHGKIRVGYRDNYMPFCKSNDDTGEIQGMLADFVELVRNAFENAEVEIEAIAYPTINDAIAALKRGEVDAAFPYGEALSDAEAENLVLADPLYNSVEMAVIRTVDQYRPYNEVRAAINSHNPNYLSLIRRRYPQWITVDYPSTVDCLNGIARGEADLLLVSSYRLGVLSQDLYENDLRAVPTGLTISYGFAARSGETEVHNILNRLTDLIDDSVVQSSLVNHTDVRVQTTMRDFIAQNVFLFFSLILLITAVITFLFMRALKERKKAVDLTEQQKEHINEIQALNNDLESQFEVIRTTSQRYFSIYAIDLETDHFQEILSAPHMSKVLGREGVASAALDKAWRALVVPEDRSVMKEFHDISQWNTYLKDKDIHSCEYRGVLNGWSRATIIAAKRNEAGNVLHVVYTLEMIHEQKEVEIALERAKDAADAASAAKTSFLFNMSHDIRTPMNAVIGFANLLRKYQDDPDKRSEYLDKMDSSSQVLLSIINNVLEMARIEKGTIGFDEIPVNAVDFHLAIQNIFKDMMKSKGIDFICTIDVQQDNVCVDPTKLREVFYNILSNAYKYTEKGSVTMDVKEIPSNDEGFVLYRTTISDTGIGMSEEFLPHIFEDFAREKNTTDNKIEGTGLGMPITKRLVELMGGTIEVTSQKGVGTTFVVTLSHKIAENKGSVVSDDSGIVSADFTGKRVLLAEDNDLNAEIAIEILSDMGLTVDRAEDGVQCVAMMSRTDSGNYDAILMDVQMPNLNGYDATRAIRRLPDPAKAGIPILAMTANAFDEDKREAARSGMNGHLSKPIDVAELTNALARILA